MGVNKKFLLLAVIILGMQTESYGQKYQNVTKEEKINISNLTSGNGVDIIAGNNQKTEVTFIKDSVIEVNGGTGIKYNIYKEGNGQNKVTNKGEIKVLKGTGIDLYANSNSFVDAKNEFYNGSDTEEGKITVSGGTGITLNSKNSHVINEAKGKIEILDGTGISLKNSSSTITNKGEIKVSKGTGILQTAGTVTNAGSINVSAGATGLDLQGGSFTNNGKINLSGETAKLDIKGGNFKNTNEIKINVTKSGAAGIVQSGGKIENSGTINVQEGKGFYIKDGEIENTGIINVNSNEQGEIKNTNIVTGIQLQGVNATFKNEGQINVLSTTTIINDKEEIKSGVGVAVSEEVKDENGKIISSFSNNGIINVKTNSKGLQITKGKAENQGVIRVEEKKATGVYLNGGSGNFENKEKAQILVSGVEAKAIHFGANGGTANNAGTIEITLGGIGAYFGGKGTFTNKKGSNIIVSGKVVEQVFKEDGTPDLDENGNPKYKTTVSKGIFLNSKGTVINEGNILVGYKVDDTGNIVLGEEGAVGVQVNDLNAQFINNKGSNIEVAGGSQGIQVNKGTAINEGNILTEGTNAVGIYMNAASKKDENGNILYEKAEFTNKNQIVASGTGAKGIQFGAGGGTVTNTGDITAENGAIGVFFYQGTNNILINSGTINAGENGSAIESGKDTNNAVILQKGSKITGKIKGNNGIDVLALDGGTHSKLNVSDYEKIVAKSGDSKIENSTISLGFKEGTDNYISENIGKAEGNVTIADSKLIIDLANKTENSTGLISGQTILDGNIKLAFNGAKGQKEFNVNEILNKDIDFSKANFGSSAMWDYTIENGNVIAKKHSYTEAVGKSQLEDFGKALEQSENGEIKDGDFKTGLTLLGLLDASQFTDAMTQLSGGVHGYTVDFAAINSRTLSNTIKNRELNKDRLRDKALNSYDQEVAYINNHHKLGGLINVDYNEDGVLGITEKQIMPNGKLGLVYGGAKGKAKFENGKHGKANMDNLYLGGYYAYDFTDKLTLVSNANFVYSHTNVTRNIKFSKEGEESKLEQTYDSTYPVFGFGGGATLYYTPYDSSNNSVTLYGGIDWTKIVQGNINEDPDNVENKTNVTIKNIPVDEQMYDSVVPHIGLSLSNNGYIFNRKYRLGVNVDYETELGNIKNGKKLKLSALSTPHRVETAERENIVSYSLNGALDLTDDFTIYGNYTKADSDEYDAERVEAGFKYKMDRMSDLFVTGPLLGNIENSKPYSRRWTGVASFILDGEDDSDRSYYTEPIMGEEHSRGDYATSLKLKPKFTLSLNDRDTKWSYYFETYYMSNGIGMNLDKNERRKSESRIHAEARWSDQYSKGKYGFNIGYRNETTSAPTLSQYVQRDRLTRGLHQFRFTPNFTYNLGNGFIFGGSTTGIIAYDYEGYRKGQTDFELENEYGITYNGLMPRWRFNVNYFREETWYDNDFRKPSVKGEVEGDRRYQSNQLRPRITYFFGNGGRVELSARMPLGNGYWYTSDDHGKKAAEKYETRYGLKYYQPITPGLTGMIGGEILTIKTKNTNHSSNDYGKETRDYSIRPTIGISYNF
ncbi:hypothetical protein I6E31_09880 [Fusobacterium varium]|nr:hypothetical protein [Fusobacterium varium]